MSEQFSNRNFTHKEMQELLPDYIFGKISPKEKSIFENSLPDYPDIRQEIEEGKAVFQRLENMNIDRLLAQKTRNLSVKVNQRLQRKPNPMERFSWSLKYAVPSFGLIILVLIMIWGNEIFKPNKNALEQKVANETSVANNLVDEYQILTQHDAAILFNNSTNQNELNNLPESALNPDYHVTMAEGTQFDNHVDNVFNNYFTNNNDLVKSAKLYLKIYSQLTSPDLIDELSQLNEDEFQQILEELENANINS